MEKISMDQDRKDYIPCVGGNKILFCKLCKNKYAQPKRLKCQHSFCKQCLIEYMSDYKQSLIEYTSEEESVSQSKEGFPCPTCSEFMYTSCEGDLSDEQVVSAMDDDVDLIEKTEISSASDFDADLEDRIPFGKVPRLTNKLSSLKIEWGDSVHKIPDCRYHGKKLDFFCKRHECIICNDCFALKHRFCDLVKCSEVVLPYLNKAMNIKEASDVNRRKAESLQKELTDMCTELAENRDSIKAEVRRFKEEMIMMLNEAESELFTDIDEVYDVRSKMYMERLHCSEIIQQNAQITSAGLKSLKKSKSPEFVVSSVIESEQCSDYERKFLEEITSTTHESKLHFTTGTSLGPFLQNTRNFGYLTVSDSIIKLGDTTKSLISKRGVLMPREIPAKLLTEENSINARVRDYESHCWITGIAFLKDGKLVMVDRNNERIKLFSANYSFVHSVKLSSSKTTLFGTTSTKDDEVAVTLTVKQCVQFLSVSEDALIPTRYVETKQPCFGVASGLNQLFVCCAQLRNAPCCIKVFDSKDNPVKEIIFDNEGNSLFTDLNLASIALDPVNNVISVVDRPLIRKSVVTFDLNGSIRSRDMLNVRDNVGNIAYFDSILLLTLVNQTLCSLYDNGSGENH